MHSHNASDEILWIILFVYWISSKASASVNQANIIDFLNKLLCREISLFLYVNLLLIYKLCFPVNINHREKNFF